MCMDAASGKAGLHKPITPYRCHDQGGNQVRKPYQSNRVGLLLSVVVCGASFFAADLTIIAREMYVLCICVNHFIVTTCQNIRIVTHVKGERQFQLGPSVFFFFFFFNILMGCSYLNWFVQDWERAQSHVS